MSSRAKVRVVLASFGLAALAASSVAAADVTLPVVTIHGRANRPNITVVLAKPTAAREASAAHDATKRAVVEGTAPRASAAKTP